ncbi:MAG: MBL fold metallo-hydrolase, partial [Desulfobacterales bacterium]|nr:MBL fold metallo-hydrolase [Desulfobacterales bacterium]
LGPTIQSLKRMLTYDFNVVFCAHRGVITDGREAIRDKLDYLCSLRDQVNALYENGASLSEITGKMLGAEDMTRVVTMGGLSKRNLIRACLSADEDRA